jgi:GNAT superfamily N-acetyltransferase
VIEVVKATMEHARAIELRDGDAREVAALGMTKGEALQMSLDRSLWADAYLVDGEVAALMGIILPSLLGGAPAAAWLITGTPVDRCRKDFLRLTRSRVREMLAQHGTLTCNVHTEYAGAIRWLRWLGFEIGSALAGFHAATLRRGLDIRASTVADLEALPGLRPLLAEYGTESAIAGLPLPSAKLAQYRALEAAGALHVISAVLDGSLIGLITVLASPLPHYGGAPVAVSESFFVRPAHRRTGAGLRLLTAAEGKARALGCSDLMVSSPIGGNLEQVLPRRGYRPTNTVFLKKVA